MRNIFASINTVDNGKHKSGYSLSQLDEFLLKGNTGLNFVAKGALGSIIHWLKDSEDCK